MPRLGLPRSGGALVATAILVAAAAGPNAPPAGAALAPSAAQPAIDAAAIRAYWTPQRMRSALPGSLLAPGGPLSAPAPAKRASLHRRVSHPAKAPKRTAGKVFFTQGIYDYQCSGTVVRAPSRSLVMSAGHCAYVSNGVLGGSYGRNWMFVPAFDHGKAPYGKWTASRLVATSGWVSSVDGDVGGINGGDSRWDVSAATMAPRSGKSIQDVVGGRKPRFSGKHDVPYDAIGYPAEAPFSGKREFECRSPYKGADRRTQMPYTISIACDMTGGSSGGGWIVGGKYIESVTSYGYNNDPNTLYGPYFGPAIQSFYNSVKG